MGHHQQLLMLVLFHTTEITVLTRAAHSVQPQEFFLMNQQYFQRLSLYVNEHTAMCARLSLGGVIETCRAVAEDRVSNAFAIVR